MRKHIAWIRTAAFAAMAVVVGATHARAAAVTLTSPGIEYGTGLYTLGFEFTVNTLQNVTALGVYDSGQNGLTAAANVGLWTNGGGAPIAQAVVPAGVGGTLDGMFRFVNIAPVTLTPGVHYVVGAFIPGFNDLATSFNTNQGGSAIVDPNINIVMDRFSPFDSAFGFPSASNFFPGGAWLGGNFTSTPVPEPASLTLLGLGLVGLRAVRRRRQA